MDQTSQEKVDTEPNPVEYTYDKKLAICRHFVKSKSTWKAQGVLKHVVDVGFVKPMEKPRDFRHKEDTQDYYGNVISSKQVYSDDDVENYFHWLVGIVAGNEEATPHVFRTAVEQLHTFLYHLRPYLVIEKDPFATPPVERRLDTIIEVLSALQEQLGARDQEMVTIFDLLAKWLDENGPILKDLKEQYQNRSKVGKP